MDEEKHKKNLENQRKWRERNREKVRKSNRIWKENNKDKERERKKIWMLNNKELCNKRSKDHNNKVRFNNLRYVVLDRDNWSCVNCGMTQEQHMIIFNRGLTIDHKDGFGRDSDIKNNSLDNLQTLCLRCHGSKDGKIRRRK